jgi:hypothetical protein
MHNMSPQRYAIGAKVSDLGYRKAGHTVPRPRDPVWSKRIKYTTYGLVSSIRHIVMTYQVMAFHVVGSFLVDLTSISNDWNRPVRGQQIIRQLLSLRQIQSTYHRHSVTRICPVHLERNTVMPRILKQVHPVVRPDGVPTKFC